MKEQQIPRVIGQPFCSNGDKNNIPENATGTNLASLQEGFPKITGIPKKKGGIPPERKDFNGAMNLNSQFYFAFQNGWLPTFNQEVSDKIGGYAKGSVLWLFNTANNTFSPLLSVVENNTYNFNTNPEYIGQYWLKVIPDTGRFLPMGSVYYSQSSQNTDNPGALPLFTGETIASANTIYPDFFAWVQKHPELTCTAEEYENALTQYGECPKYVLSDGALRLPLLKNYIKMADTAEGITVKESGLPNITGGLDNAMSDADNGASGAFGRVKADNYGGNNSGFPRTSVDFDASRSSAVYGRSDTVTPAHTTLYPWVVAYNGAVEASVAQAAEFQNALSGKADTSLGNVAGNIDYVVERWQSAEPSVTWGGVNFYNSWEKYKSGWIKQTIYSLRNNPVTWLKPFAKTPHIKTDIFGTVANNYTTHYIRRTSGVDLKMGCTAEWVGDVESPYGLIIIAEGFAEE